MKVLRRAAALARRSPAKTVSSALGARMRVGVVEAKKRERSEGRLPKVALGQMRSVADATQNFERVRQLAVTAQGEGCTLLALPECFSFLGENSAESLAVAEELDGPLTRTYAALAKQTGLWLSLGGFQEKGPDDGHLYNTHVILTPEGEISAAYRKIHLFTYEDEENDIHLKESSFTAPGKQALCCDSPVGRLGLSVCYDLRFPQLYQTLRFEMGAEVLTVPSAFTVPTGKAHWEVLLRARAVETQCYVAAAAQVGRHNSKRVSYGHSMAVDPWGDVLIDLGEEENAIGIFEVDLAKLRKLRTSMPLDQHRSAFSHPHRILKGYP